MTGTRALHGGLKKFANNSDRTSNGVGQDAITHGCFRNRQNPEEMRMTEGELAISDYHDMRLTHHHAIVKMENATSSIITSLVFRLSSSRFEM